MLKENPLMITKRMKTKEAKRRKQLESFLICLIGGKEVTTTG